MNAIYLLAAAGALMASGDIALAAWARSGHAWALGIGLLLNMAGILAYAHTLGAENIGAATAVLLGLNIVAVAAMGFLLFGQSMSLMRMAGMVFLTGSIIFIEIVG